MSHLDLLGFLLFGFFYQLEDVTQAGNSILKFSCPSKLLIDMTLELGTDATA